MKKLHKLLFLLLAVSLTFTQSCKQKPSNADISKIEIYFKSKPSEKEKIEIYNFFNNNGIKTEQGTIVDASETAPCKNKNDCIFLLIVPTKPTNPGASGFVWAQLHELKDANKNISYISISYSMDFTK